MPPPSLTLLPIPLQLLPLLRVRGNPRPREFPSRGHVLGGMWLPCHRLLYPLSFLLTSSRLTLPPFSLWTEPPRCASRTELLTCWHRSGPSRWCCVPLVLRFRWRTCCGMCGSFGVSKISTLVVAEHDGGSIKPSSLSAIAAANKLGEDNSISMLLAGSGPSLQQAALQASSCHPSVSEVLVADSDKFACSLAEPWTQLINMVQKKGGYSHVIAASGSFGKNIIPRAAALVDVSPVTDVTDISGSNEFVRPVYAGNALSTVRYIGEFPCMLTIRSTSFPVTSESRSEAATISQVDLSNFGGEIVGKSRYVSLSSQNSECPDLGNARVVVTGGRALKSAENFKMIEQLAEKLGAAVGATRAAVDAGYVPNDLQVGQTGKIVAPDLYMAFGVSGAIQHLAGIRDSKVIVAVNKDADAPIFQVADYGLVGDLFEIIPELLEKLPDKK